MRVEVYEEKPTEEPEKVLRLRLEDRGYCVSVVAVNERGERMPEGYLLSFEEDGTISRHICVSAGLGLRLNDRGQVIDNG